MEEERNFARQNDPIDTIESNNLQPIAMGNDAGPIRENFASVHARAEQQLAVPSMAQNTSNVARTNPNQQRAMRGRIHASNDVLNGISGMEHLSNSLQNRNKNGITASPAIMAQMRAGPYAHHASQPEAALLDQLKGVNTGNGNGTPNILGMNSGGGAVSNVGMKSSQSRGNLPSMPELEYDPWYANQQRYLAQ